MDAPRFSLMRLPVACSQNVLRFLTATELFEITLASKKSKALVQSLKIKASVFIVRIYNKFFSIRLGVPLRGSGDQYLLDLWDIYLDYEDIHYERYSSKMDQRTFINHLEFIFNTERIKVDFGSNIEKIDFESILKGRQDVGNIRLTTDNQDEKRRILNFINPSIVSIVKIPRPIDVLIQNIDYLRFCIMKICLEDLLVLNSRNFNTNFRRVSTKVLNRFLKLWTRGSNPQLENLTLGFPFDNNFRQEEIFDRLKTTHNNTTRYFNSASGIRKITDETDIMRFDGTKATIRVYERRRLVIFFEFFVWHDHCLANETDYNCSSD